VDQLSLPYRIGLVALVLVGALWFVVLKPKPVTTSQSAPGATGLANDVNKAKGAVDASNGSATATDAAGNAAGGSTTTTTPAAGTTPSTGKTTTPGQTAKPAKPSLAAAAVAGDPSRAILAAVDKGKVAVILFWNRKASDDRATRQALRKIDRHHGKVVTRAIAISQVGKYEAITRGAQVLESPTVMVIGAGGKARSITGYTQASEINGLVSTVGGKGY
jgi:cytoskeletal protein RodZ